jgi:hypothetical protein
VSDRPPLLLANGDLLVADRGGVLERRVTKGTPEHKRLLAAIAAGAVEVERPRGRFGGREHPPAPRPNEVLSRLGVADADRKRQHEVAMAAAYAGRLSLGELRALREADLIPYSEDD